MSMEDVLIINKKVKNLIDTQSTTNGNLINAQTNSINSTIGTNATNINNNVNSKISSQTTSINNNTNTKTTTIINKIGTENTSVANEATVFNFLKKIYNTVSSAKTIKSLQKIESIVFATPGVDYTDITISNVNINHSIIIPNFFLYEETKNIRYLGFILYSNKVRVYHSSVIKVGLTIRLQVVEFNH